jgi:hypothetical protein
VLPGQRGRVALGEESREVRPRWTSTWGPWKDPSRRRRRTPGEGPRRGRSRPPPPPPPVRHLRRKQPRAPFSSRTFLASRRPVRARDGRAAAA